MNITRGVCGAPCGFRGFGIISGVFWDLKRIVSGGLRIINGV